MQFQNHHPLPPKKEKRKPKEGPGFSPLSYSGDLYQFTSRELKIPSVGSAVNTTNLLNLGTECTVRVCCFLSLLQVGERLRFTALV